MNIKNKKPNSLVESPNIITLYQLENMLFKEVELIDTNKRLK